jgi:hypothetical protein
MENPVFVPLHLSANEAHRLFWDGQYYALEMTLIFQKQAQNIAQVQANLENTTLLVQLTPFCQEFRAKMLIALAGSVHAAHKTESFAVFLFHFHVNLLLGTILNLSQVQRFFTTLHTPASALPGPAFTNPVLENAPLTAEQKQNFLQTFEKELLHKDKLLPHLKHPFASFFPQLLPSQWKKELGFLEPPRMPHKRSLMPFQAAFPFSGNFKRLWKHKTYLMDDLYCVSENCNCHEVTCVVLSVDPEHAQETTHGGFKYHLGKKSFKKLPQFPKNFNAQEWFQQFSKQSPVHLHLVLESRYHFLKNEINFK